MPPKKTEGASTKSKAPASHPSYQDMISEAITQLKDRNGSSRQSLKKYVKANYNIQTQTDAMFDSLFNRALKKGVETGHFVQPKGASGGTKLAKKSAPVKKEAAPKEKKPASEKPAAKKPAAKKAAPKKEGAAKKAAPKKAAATKKTAAPKKKATDAPAVVDKPTSLTKTKSGRVAKTAAKPATKKAAPKKAAPKKEKTPKKAAATPATA